MEVMIPVWPDNQELDPATNQVMDLRGVDVAFVDDNLDIPFCDEVEKQLTERYGAIIRRLIKPVSTAASPRSLIEQAAQSKLALVGVGL